MSVTHPEITIIGGGVVGLSVAMGLLQAGRQVHVLDGADNDARASQGNFGLIWGQSKGWNFAPYAKWTSKAQSVWPDFATQLKEISGIDVALKQAGGFEFFTDTDELNEFAEKLELQQKHVGNRFSYQVLNGDDLRRQIRGIGEGVVGATFSQQDGHVNPLRLLHALRLSVQVLGGVVTENAHVDNITPLPQGGFDLTLANGDTNGADKVLLCAGLGAMKLAGQLGFQTKIRPEKGELLITEKLGDHLPFMSSTIRQVDEGGIQIGGTKADAGMDESETLAVMTSLACHAVRVFPALAKVRVIRAWGALRIMSPDGFPVYAQSREYPGSYLITCHSGVTLAALHASVLADWIENTSAAPNLEAFDEHRFTFSNAA